MARGFDDRTFAGARIYERGWTMEDFECRRCEFVDSVITTTRDPTRRPVMKRGRLVRCLVENCRIGGAVLEDIEILGLRTKGICRITASVFKHVTLRGPIDEVLISPLIWPGPASKADQERFDRANATYYGNVDWAIDITEADFINAEIQGIPARLIRRDVASQAVITREAALEGNWRGIELSNTPWPAMIQFLLDDGFAEKILIAPRRNPNFDALARGLERLRDAGIAT